MPGKISVYEVSGTTDGSGDSTDYSRVIRGCVKSVQLDIDALDAGADITITTEDELSAQTIYTKDDSNTNATVYPRVALQDNGGTAVTYDGTNEIYGEYVVMGRLKVVVAQGGNTKAYKIHVVVEEY